METPKNKWESTIEPLVVRLKLDQKTVTDKIVAAKLVEAADDSGADVLMDAEALTGADFTGAFPEAAKGTLNLAVKEIRAKAVKVEAPVAAPAVTPVVTTATIGAAFVIPDVPEGSDFLTALSTSKTLTVDLVSIRSALEALFADSRALAEIPEKLAHAMEKHADTIEEPVGDAFLEVLRFVKERRYAEINVDSKLVTKERKKVVVDRLRDLPRAVLQFHMVLTGWNEQLKSNRSSNPFGVLQGGAAAMYPPADEVIAAAEGVVGCLRKAFGGYGVMVSRAMAYEGLKIKETLERSELPALMGVSNRELMLKQLGIDLTNADVRAERNVARYVIFVATTVNTALPGGQEGPVLESLYNLGQTILPWMNGGVSNGYAAGGGVTVTPGNRKSGGWRTPVDPHPVGRSFEDAR